MRVDEDSQCPNARPSGHVLAIYGQCTRAMPVQTHPPTPRYADARYGRKALTLCHLDSLVPRRYVHAYAIVYIAIYIHSVSILHCQRSRTVARWQR